MTTLPYVMAYGNVTKAINGIKAAATPERVSQDFVKTILGIGGGSGDQMTSFLKKIGLADSTGVPTDTYKKIRNETTSRAACAEALKFGYKPIFVKNEFTYKLGDEALKGLIVEITGQAADSQPVSCTLNCFKNLRAFAEFNSEQTTKSVPSPEIVVSQNNNGLPPPIDDTPEKIGLKLSYTINLNLPATTDVAVFNAIFKSLKEHLLKE